MVFCYSNPSWWGHKYPQMIIMFEDIPQFQAFWPSRQGKNSVHVQTDSISYDHKPNADQSVCVIIFKKPVIKIKTHLQFGIDVYLCSTCLALYEALGIQWLTRHVIPAACTQTLGGKIATKQTIIKTSVLKAEGQDVVGAPRSSGRSVQRSWD